MLKMCGARDTVSFKAVMEQKANRGSSKKPSSDSITYEGLYSEHTFHTGREEQKIVSCEPRSRISPDPFSKKNEYYMSLFINSKYDGEGIVKRPPLNLVICLDISGSMGSPFRSRSSSKM